MRYKPMPIKIKVGEVAAAVEKEYPVVSKGVNVKRSLSGELLFMSHPHLDLVVKENKVIAFSKNGKYTDEAYAAMKRLFDFLARKGIVFFDSIQGGNIYGSLEGKLQQSLDDEAVKQLVIFQVGVFLETENDEIYDDYYEQEVDDWYTEPTAEDSTALGKVPQEPKKGSIPQTPSPVTLVYRI